MEHKITLELVQSIDITKPPNLRVKVDGFSTKEACRILAKVLSSKLDELAAADAQAEQIALARAQMAGIPQ